MDKNCSHLHSKFHYVSIKIVTFPSTIAAGLPLNSTMFLLRSQPYPFRRGSGMTLNSTMFLLRYKPPWLKKNVLSCSKFHYVSIKMIQISDRIMFLAFSKFHYVSIKMEQQRKTAIKRSALNSTMFLLRSHKLFQFFHGFLL